MPARAGNRHLSESGPSGDMRLVKMREYVYDGLNRMVTARLNDAQDSSTASQQTCWYQYDDLGNRISQRQRAASAIVARDAGDAVAVAPHTLFPAGMRRL